jgi:hypothetical protein
MDLELYIFLWDVLHEKHLAPGLTGCWHRITTEIAPIGCLAIACTSCWKHRNRPPIITIVSDEDDNRRMNENRKRDG